MKKVILLAVAALMLQSCYTTQVVYGEGAQTYNNYKYKQHHFIAGLVSLQNDRAQSHINNVENCEVTIQHTFVDGLINFITGGIYTPITINIKE